MRIYRNVVLVLTTTFALPHVTAASMSIVGFDPATGDVGIALASNSIRGVGRVSSRQPTAQSEATSSPSLSYWNPRLTKSLLASTFVRIPARASVRISCST